MEVEKSAAIINLDEPGVGNGPEKKPAGSDAPDQDGDKAV